MAIGGRRPVGRNIGRNPQGNRVVVSGPVGYAGGVVPHCHQLLGADNSPAEIELIPEMPMTPTDKVAKADLPRRKRERKG